MFGTIIFCTLFSCLVAVGSGAGGDARAENQQGTLHQRTYFYVGQSYAPQGNSSIAFGQMYVEHLVPEKVTRPFPLLFIHGHGKHHPRYRCASWNKGHEFEKE